MYSADEESKAVKVTTIVKDKVFKIVVDAETVTICFECEADIERCSYNKVVGGEQLNFFQWSKCNLNHRDR